MAMAVAGLTLAGCDESPTQPLEEVPVQSVVAAVGKDSATTSALGASAMALGLSSGVTIPVVTLTPVDGNPSCQDLGYDFGFKVDGSANGTYTFTSADGELTGSTPDDPTNSVTISNSDGVYFDWSSTLGIDLVIVKGGPNANTYGYEPDAYEDTGLHAPVNDDNGTPYGLSHIEFCYDYELDVSKTAVPSFVRTYRWTIDKTASPEEVWRFAGETAPITYTVSVDQSHVDSDWAVTGAITIANNTPFGAVVTDVADTLTGGLVAPVDCGVTFPFDLGAGESLGCTYGRDLPDGSQLLNTASVTTDGIVGGGSGTADVSFGEPTTVHGYGDINVSDTNGKSWAASGDATWTYTENRSCSSEPASYTDGRYEYTHVNTASIDETGASDDASVKVNCYAPVVSKTAVAEFTRTYQWTISKTSDDLSVTLSAGDANVYDVWYDVTASATYQDGAWYVSGAITVQNPNPQSALTVALADIMSGDIAATLDCGGTLTIPAGGSETCGYEADLPDGSNRVNTATATFNDLDFTGTAAVAFGTPTLEVDRCITVSDDLLGGSKDFCFGDTLPWTYKLTIGPYGECGSYQVVNTASFTSQDRGLTGSSSWTVNVNVVGCGYDDGCTLTPGYWKTHSDYGPARYDATWVQVGGPDEPFFLSGQSWYQVLWTPVAGDAYYILARAYIATALNSANGAVLPAEVLEAFEHAADLLSTTEPGVKKGNVRKDFVATAQILDDYNNGLAGVLHCSDNTSEL
jgi:hypothetical protein